MRRNDNDAAGSRSGFAVTRIASAMVIAVAIAVLASCSSGSGTSAGPAASTNASASATPTGQEDYPIAPCRFLTVRDIAAYFPAPAGWKWQQELNQPDPGECHWLITGSSTDTNHPRDDFGLVVAARAPQFGLAPPASEPNLDGVPADIRAKVSAGVRRITLGAASGWFNPYYQVQPGSKQDTHLDLAVGQYNLRIYADTSRFLSAYQRVEDAATAASDLAAAERIATAVIARLPAVPPPPQ